MPVEAAPAAEVDAEGEVGAREGAEVDPGVGATLETLPGLAAAQRRAASRLPVAGPPGSLPSTCWIEGVLMFPISGTLLHG